MGILSCSVVLAVLYLVEADSKTCPEIITLPSFGDTRDPVYQKEVTFPCAGHLIGWRAIGSIPTYNICFGVWIPNNGSRKRLKFVEPITQSSVLNIEPLTIESGDSMGFILLKDDSFTVPDFARLPLQDQTVDFYSQNKSLVAIVPHNTTRGSILNIEKMPYMLVLLEFKFLVEMDYKGRYKAHMETSEKRTRNKRDKGKRCKKFPNCELCRKVKGKIVCSLCKDGFFGRTCKNICPEGCFSCDQESGNCDRCSVGYFGQNCKEMCPTGCNPSMGCNADSGCVECRLGWQGKWCKDVIASCDEGSFLGAKCKDVCPQNCAYCNISDSTSQCIVCRKDSQWKQCINTVIKNRTEGSTSLEVILIPVFLLLVLGGAVAGVVIFLKRRRQRNNPKGNEVVLEMQNGLPSLNALQETERRSNSYVDNLPPSACQSQSRQSRQLPPLPSEDEEGYMTPQKQPDVTSPLLQEQHSDEKQGSKSLPCEAGPSGPSLSVENVYEVMGEVEPIEETFE